MILNNIDLGRYGLINLLKDKIYDARVNIKSQRNVLLRGQVLFFKMPFHYYTLQLSNKYFKDSIIYYKQIYKIHYTFIKSKFIFKNFNIDYQYKFRFKLNPIKLQFLIYNRTKDILQSFHNYKPIDSQRFYCILVKQLFKPIINVIPLVNPNFTPKKKKIQVKRKYILKNQIIKKKLKTCQIYMFR